MAEPLCPSCRERDTLIASLRERLAVLESKVRELGVEAAPKATSTAAERPVMDEGAGHDRNDESPLAVQLISVVVPVYQGEATLEALVAEIEPLTCTQFTPHGSPFRIAEVVLVHDGAVDNSDVVMQSLARRNAFLKSVWLSRNFGQHPATLAGAASTTGDWVVTIDEDGQQDPKDIGRLLDRALETGSQLVYAEPTNLPPHGRLRNLFSALVKRFFVRVLVNNAAVGRFNSYRLIDGEIARSLAAYCGPNVYLDVALSWVVARSAHCPLQLREGSRRRSGYNLHKLASHFWRLVLSSGTRPLRVISLLGLAAIGVATALTIYAVYEWLTGTVSVQGWTSLTVMLCFFAGCILFSLGIIVEFLGMAVSPAVGKPLFLVVSRPVHKKGPAV